MLHLAQEMKVADRPLPHILLVQISQPVAEAMGFEGSAMRTVYNAPKSPEGSVAPQDGGVPPRPAETKTLAYYEVWLVGDVGSKEYVAAIQQVLAVHFQLEFSPAERTRIVSHVVQAMDVPANAKDLGE